MKTVNKVITAIMLSALTVLAVPLQSVQANDDFRVIRAGSRRVGDNGSATNPRSFTFSLPSNIIRSSSTSNRAVLEYQVRNTQDNYNEIFVNPPTPFCLNNNSDSNQSASIGMIEDYDADDNMEDDYFTEHRSFRSNLLRAGTNTIMVCARSSGGGVSGSLDDFWIRHIVLHYKTSSFGLVLGQ